MKEFSYKDIEAATGGFAVDRLIGKGSHGSVYQGRLKGGKLVAVKKPSADDGSKVANEIEILASVKNPSVVNLLGVCRGPTNSKLLVMEFMPHGSLHDLLHSSLDPPTWPWRAAMAVQIARAILSLHEAAAPVIHRDIKSANILLDRHRKARLADFSLAVRADDGLRPRSAVDAAVVPAGTIGYLDPCYTESAMLGPENDVFSFGVVLLELVSARKVIDTERDPASIVAWAVPMIGDRRTAEVCDRRVALPGGMAGPIGRMLGVAAQCVSERMERRPVMGAVVRELEGVVESIWWPIWGPVCCKVYDRVYRCARAWRRRVKKRVAASKLWAKASLESVD